MADDDSSPNREKRPRDDKPDVPEDLLRFVNTCKLITPVAKKLRHHQARLSDNSFRLYENILRAEIDNGDSNTPSIVDTVAFMSAAEAELLHDPQDTLPVGFVYQMRSHAHAHMVKHINEWVQARRPRAQLAVPQLGVAENVQTAQAEEEAHAAEHEVRRQMWVRALMIYAKLTEREANAALNYVERSVTESTAAALRRLRAAATAAGEPDGGGACGDGNAATQAEAQQTAAANAPVAQRSVVNT